MAIKTKNSRDTYRSNVKIRPLRQNGLEAQYQGLDITEVNIDHAGLAIIGRGGHQTRRDIRKVRKQYIVDVPQEEHNPKAELVFLTGGAGDPFNVDTWDDGTNNPAVSLQDLDTETFDVRDQDGTSFTFRFTNDSAHTNGEAIPTSTDIAVNIFENNFSKRELMFAITGSIEAAFPKDTFQFELYSSGTIQAAYGYPEGIEITEDKIVMILSSSVPGQALLTATSAYLGDTNNFVGQNESHEWRLNGFLKDNSNRRIFYEDLRTDTIMSTEPHPYRNEGMLFRKQQFDGSVPSEDLKNFYDKNVSSIASDPTTLSRFSTHDSEEVLIRQFPKREELFDTYRDNFEWREDIHYLAPDQQVWSKMEEMALNYHSSLEEHIASMMNSNFADEQYIDPNPLSGRVDVFKRLSRIFDTHVDLIYERHPYSVFDQFLDPIDDFKNLQENRFPKEDCTNDDAPFEDVRGRRSELGPDFDNGGEFWTKGDGLNDYWAGQNTMMFTDFFDQEPLETHDYREVSNWTRIDEKMLQVLTEEGYSSETRPRLIISITDNWTNPLGSLYFRSSPEGNELEKKWWEIQFVENGGNSTTTEGFTTDVTRDGRTKETAYKARILYQNSSTLPDITPVKGHMSLRLSYIFNNDPSTSVFYTHNGNISGLRGWGSLNPFWDIDISNQSANNYYAIAITSSQRDQGFDFESVEIDDGLGLELSVDVNFRSTNRSYLIDKREWMLDQYVYTATGFINSQTSGHDGIIYRDMKR